MFGFPSALVMKNSLYFMLPQLFDQKTTANTLIWMEYENFDKPPQHFLDGHQNPFWKARRFQGKVQKWFVVGNLGA